MRLFLELKKGTNSIFFPAPILEVNEIKLNKSDVKWTIYNISDGDKIAIDSTEHEIPPGYYSFDDLKEYLEGKNCTVSLEKSGKCTITPPSTKTLHLKKLGKLLGFNENDSLSVKKESPYLVDVHGGLSKIEIFCNRIDSHRNFINGKYSEKLTQILSPGGDLFGTTSTHDFGDAFIPMEKNELISMEFYVRDYSFLTDKNSYTIFLNCEIR